MLMDDVSNPKVMRPPSRADCKQRELGRGSGLSHKDTVAPS